MRFRPARDDDDGDGSTDGPHSDGGFDLADVGGPGGDRGVGDFRGGWVFGTALLRIPDWGKGVSLLRKYFQSLWFRQP